MAFGPDGAVTWFGNGYELYNNTWTRVGDDVSVSTNGGAASLTGTINGDAISFQGVNNFNGFTFTLGDV